jgi:hypothetical protein
MQGVWLIVGTWAVEDDRAAANTELLWTILLLAGLLLAAVVLIVWAKRWRTRGDLGEMTFAEQEAYYRNLLAQGEISREEYERITGVLHSPRQPAKQPPERSAPTDRKSPNGDAFRDRRT